MVPVLQRLTRPLPHAIAIKPTPASHAYPAIPAGFKKWVKDAPGIALLRLQPAPLQSGAIWPFHKQFDWCDEQKQDFLVPTAHELLEGSLVTVTGMPGGLLHLTSSEVC